MFLYELFNQAFYKFSLIVKNNFLITYSKNSNSIVLNLFTTISYFILTRCKNLILVPSVVCTSNIGIVYDMDCGVADPGVWLFAYDLYYSISSVSVFVVLFVGFYLYIIYQSFKIKPITAYFNIAERLLSGVDVSAALNLSKSWKAAYESHYNRYFYKWYYDYSHFVSPKSWFGLLTQTRKNVLLHKKNYVLTHGLLKNYYVWLETWSYRVFLLRGYYKTIEAKVYEKPALYIELAWTVLPTSIVSLIVIPSLSLIFFIHSGYLVFKLSWWRRYSYLASPKNFNVIDLSFQKPETIRDRQKLNSTISAPKLLNVIVEGNQWFWSYKIEPKDARSYLEFLRGYKYDLSYQNDIVSTDFFNFVESNLDDYLLEYDSYMVRDQELEVGDVRLLTTDIPLYLPNNTIVNFHILSNDVIHSFAVPQFFIKADAIPGRITTVRFDTSYVFGLFYGQCSEICGVNHAFMPIAINVIESFYYNAKALINNNLVKKKYKYSDHYLGCSGYNPYERLRVGFDITNFYFKKASNTTAFTKTWSYFLSDWWLEQYRVGSYEGRYAMAKNLIELTAASAVNCGLNPHEQLNAISTNLKIFMNPLPTLDSVAFELTFNQPTDLTTITDADIADTDMAFFFIKTRSILRLFDRKNYWATRLFPKSTNVHFQKINVNPLPNKQMTFDLLAVLTTVKKVQQLKITDKKDLLNLYSNTGELCINGSIQLKTY